MINSRIKIIIDTREKKFDNIKNNYIINNPDTIISQYNNTYELLLNKLNLLNPLNILSKGYSVTTIGDKAIKDIKEVKVKDKINIKLYKGNIKAIVEGCEE